MAEPEAKIPPAPAAAGTNPPAPTAPAASEVPVAAAPASNPTETSVPTGEAPGSRDGFGGFINKAKDFLMDNKVAGAIAGVVALIASATGLGEMLGPIGVMLLAGLAFVAASMAGADDKGALKNVLKKPEVVRVNEPEVAIDKSPKLAKATEVPIQTTTQVATMNSKGTLKEQAFYVDKEGNAIAEGNIETKQAAAHAFVKGEFVKDGEKSVLKIKEVALKKDGDFQYDAANNLIKQDVRNTNVVLTIGANNEINLSEAGNKTSMQNAILSAAAKNEPKAEPNKTAGVTVPSTPLSNDKTRAAAIT
jgi:hypothetical protein